MSSESVRNDGTVIVSFFYAIARANPLPPPPPPNPLIPPSNWLPPSRFSRKKKYIYIYKNRDKTSKSSRRSKPEISASQEETTVNFQKISGVIRKKKKKEKTTEWKKNRKYGRGGGEGEKIPKHPSFRSSFGVRSRENIPWPPCPPPTSAAPFHSHRSEFIISIFVRFFSF